MYYENKEVKVFLLFMIFDMVKRNVCFIDSVCKIDI